MNSKIFSIITVGVLLLLQGCASGNKPVVPSDKVADVAAWLRAASKGDMEYLKQNTAMVRTYNMNGTTALMAASARGHVEVAKFLLDAGENINGVDINNDTALFYSITQNKENTFDLLLEQKAKANGTRVDGITPLMVAIDNNRMSMAEKLIKYQVDVNEKTEDGWTAIFFTIRLRNLKMAKLLVQAGAKTDITDKDGRTPLDYAKEDKWATGITFFEQATKSN